MKIIRGSKNLPKGKKSPILTMGNFDGVHLGHQKIFKEVKRIAHKSNGVSIAYTYSPHPVRLLAPHEAPLLIQTETQKFKSIEACEIDFCIIEKFNKGFSELKPDQFFEHIILKNICPTTIIVGYDFTFGYHRSGTTELLEKFCGDSGISFQVIPALFIGNKLLSSTQIRRYITDGHIEEANSMLGRKYSIEGVVKKGKGIGKSLGFHTANLKTPNELIPPQGVYISYTTIGGSKPKRHQSLTNIGYNPTFGGTELSIETHILDYSGNLYGTNITVEFLKRIRSEMLFDNPGQLQRQIHMDIKLARAYLKTDLGRR